MKIEYQFEHRWYAVVILLLVFIGTTSNIQPRTTSILSVASAAYNTVVPIKTSSYVEWNSRNEERSHNYHRQWVLLPTVRRNFMVCHASTTNTDTTTTFDEDDDATGSGKGKTNENLWMGHDMYQRIFYRFSHGSDVTIHDAIIVEERCRFVVDPQRPDYMIPNGPRTLLLRNGLGMDFDSGEIGDDFYTIQVASGTTTTAASTTSSMINTNAPTVHNGAGNDPAVQSAIACAIYLACNPDICQGRMLEISANTGLGSLLGCIGAGYVVKYNQNADVKSTKTSTDDIVDDILTIGKDRKGPFPPELELLSITDVNEDQLLKVMNNLKASGLKSGYKVNLDVLDWRTRKIQPRINRSSSLSQSAEYRSVVASDIVISYPETKELARAVAHRVEPITPYIYQTESKSTTLPSFIHVCPDDRDDVTYLRRILEKGYLMSVSTKFLKLEKLIFHLQKLPSGQPESDLDDIELELKDCKEIKYQALVAQHHPDYAGAGSGEWFFPMETGEYEATGGSIFLEKEAGSSPW